MSQVYIDNITIEVTYRELVDGTLSDPIPQKPIQMSGRSFAEAAPDNLLPVIVPTGEVDENGQPTFTVEWKTRDGATSHVARQLNGNKPKKKSGGKKKKK